MGAYSEYLAKNWNYTQLSAERKAQLQRIQSIRKRDLLVIAADLTKSSKAVSVSMDYGDILPVQDQLATLTGKELDVIIETPGGQAEVAEDIVRMIRNKYEKVAVIIPGWAKSAGTIFAMAGDEILMGEGSALGPIDPQLIYGNGKRFSADALLEGLDKIKQEVTSTGKLNPAYIPILQAISPGEIQNCVNAREFSQVLVRSWLAEYKFKYWEKHKSSGLPVTPDEKQKRAKEIAEALCDHSRWLTHGRSIKRKDLEALRLVVSDYSSIPDLNDAITRYYTLLKMCFERANIHKIYETPTSQVIRTVNTVEAAPLGGPVIPGLSNAKKNRASAAVVEIECPQCQKKYALQLNLDKPGPTEPKHTPYPIGTDTLKCSCGAECNLTPLRLSIEAQTGKKVV